MSQDDRTLSRAIEESLSSTYNDQTTEIYEPWPEEKKAREGSWSVLDYFTNWSIFLIVPFGLLALLLCAQRTEHCSTLLS